MTNALYWGAAAIGMLCLTYCCYNQYVKNNNDYAALVAELAAKGITVYKGYNEIGLKGEKAYLYHESGYKLVQYANNNETLVQALMCGCCSSPIFGFFSICHLYQGLNQDFDKEHLSKYKNILRFLDEKDHKIKVY